MAHFMTDAARTVHVRPPKMIDTAIDEDEEEDITSSSSSCSSLVQTRDNADDHSTTMMMMITMGLGDENWIPTIPNANPMQHSDVGEGRDDRYNRHRYHGHHNDNDNDNDSDSDDDKNNSTDIGDADDNNSKTHNKTHKTRKTRNNKTHKTSDVESMLAGLAGDDDRSRGISVNVDTEGMDGNGGVDEEGDENGTWALNSCRHQRGREMRRCKCPLIQDQGDDHRYIHGSVNPNHGCDYRQRQQQQRVQYSQQRQQHQQHQQYRQHQQYQQYQQYIQHQQHYQQHYHHHPQQPQQQHRQQHRRRSSSRVKIPTSDGTCNEIHLNSRRIHVDPTTTTSTTHHAYPRGDDIVQERKNQGDDENLMLVAETHTTDLESSVVASVTAYSSAVSLRSDHTCDSTNSTNSTNSHHRPQQQTRNNSSSSSITTTTTTNSDSSSNLYHHPQILCANCGCAGHVYRVCGHPVTSFGIVCYRWNKADPSIPEYLMVQRKDSLCFVEFIRGKYSLQNRNYIMKLFRSMTTAERNHICTLDFDNLWYGFWQTDHNRGFMKEYHQAKDKFKTLRLGYYLRDTNNKVRLDFFSLDRVMKETTPDYEETEWGFPKGRRNINEKDLRCAMREFREETGIELKEVVIHTHIKPFEEVFTGCNRVRYRHVYYLAQLKSDADEHLGDVMELPSGNTREIRKVVWFGYDDAMEKIRPHNVERRELFRRLHNTILSPVSCTTELIKAVDDSLASLEKGGTSEVHHHYHSLESAIDARSIVERREEERENDREGSGPPYYSKCSIEKKEDITEKIPKVDDDDNHAESKGSSKSSESSESSRSNTSSD